MSRWIKKAWDGGARFYSFERLAKLIFVLGLCVLAYSYGVVTIQWKVFPYETLKQVNSAWNALQKIEDDELPVYVLRYEDETNVPQRVHLIDDRAGTENLLIAGGFQHRLDLCPSHGCLAWIMDRSGQILHTWEADPAELKRGLEGLSGRASLTNFWVIGVALSPGGELVIVFQGRNLFPYQVGIAKLDVDGKMLWARFDQSHHWPTVDENGQIYVPYGKIVQDVAYFGDTATKLKCEDGQTYMEGVRVLSPDGSMLREFYMPDIIAQADYPGMLYALRDGCDPFHVNAISFVPAVAAAKLPRVEAGDLLVSLREPSALLILNRETGALNHLITGRTSAQHSPQFLPDGTVVVFDNLGGKRELGGSRIVRIDLASGAMENVYPKGDEGDLLPFFSSEAGVLSVSPDGRRILASETREGKIIEIDVETGDPLWVYENITDLGPYLKARNIETESTIVRFATQGAYYVDDLSFLDR